MILHISNVSSEDFSSYRCVAVNALGETDGIIKLYGTHTSYYIKLKWSYPTLSLSTIQKSTAEMENVLTNNNWKRIVLFSYACVFFFRYESHFLPLLTVFDSDNIDIYLFFLEIVTAAESSNEVLLEGDNYKYSVNVTEVTGN